MPIELSQANADAPLRLRLDEEVTLRLEENPTTGYRWEFDHSGSGELALVDSRFEHAGQAIPGAAGQRVVRLAARRAGDVQVQALKRRAWDDGQEAIDRRAFMFVIG